MGVPRTANRSGGPNGKRPSGPKWDLSPFSARRGAAKIRVVSQAREQTGVPDEPERENIREEARAVAGDDWLDTENERLGGRTPRSVIDSGAAGEELVRDILRSIRYIGSS
jgi:Antitoxin Xre/MbcA/ParS C-terminal toxin-binding domain